jgi:serine/threonine protein kinase
MSFISYNYREGYIKTSIVFLDKELNAKISDFGLAKLNEDDNTHISPRIAGTK